MVDFSLYLVWFVAAASFLLLLFVALSAGLKNAAAVAPDPSGGTAVSLGSASLGGVAPTRPVDRAVAERLRKEKKQAETRARLVQAGLYNRNASVVFLATRVMLGGCMVGLGLAISSLGLLPLPIGLGVGLLCGIAGTIAPSFWLDHVKRVRQTQIRRALPDALDVLGICLEGGLSLSGGLVRVARELGTAHPMLALELAIVERETQMGMSTGEALRRFADRFDLEELRSLSAVITQAERLGSSVNKALQVFAETLRVKRHQRAQEMAQKAAIKILFPTLFLIFPGLFVVILGPAAIQIYKVLILGQG